MHPQIDAEVHLRLLFRIFTLSTSGTLSGSSPITDGLVAGAAYTADIEIAAMQRRRIVLDSTMFAGCSFFAVRLAVNQ